MSFATELKALDWDSVGASIAAKTERDVERALSRAEGGLTLEDFKALIAPSARPYLETMAQMSHQRTVARFGYTQQLYAPLYLSNVCSNICTYCGFSANNRIPRKY